MIRNQNKIITENQNKASNDIKSLNSVSARTSWDRSQHLLQSDYDHVTIRHSLTKVTGV